MSLMNYGFTKSKVDENDNGKRSEEKIKEKSPSKTSKPAPKSVKEARKDKKISSSKSSSKKDSKKTKDKSHVKKKSSSKKLSIETKQTSNNSSSSTNSPSKMNGVHKLNIKTENAIASNNVGGEDGSGSSSSNNSPKKSPHDVSLPYVRIKMIMKSCPDVEIVPHESLHVITKATEFFIQYLATESLKSSDSKILDYEALSTVVHNDDNLEFLKETVPKKITWQECQKLIAANKTNSFSEP